MTVSRPFKLSRETRDEVRRDVARLGRTRAVYRQLASKHRCSETTIARAVNG